MAESLVTYVFKNHLGSTQLGCVMKLSASRLSPSGKGPYSAQCAHDGKAQRATASEIRIDFTQFFLNTIFFSFQNWSERLSNVLLWVMTA